MCPRILFPVWFSVSVGHKRYLHEMLEVKVSSCLLHALKVAVQHCDSSCILLLICWLTLSAWGSTQDCSSSSCHQISSLTFLGKCKFSFMKEDAQLLQVTRLIKTRVTERRSCFQVCPCCLLLHVLLFLSHLLFQLTCCKFCPTPGATTLQRLLHHVSQLC